MIQKLKYWAYVKWVMDDEAKARLFNELMEDDRYLRIAFMKVARGMEVKRLTFNDSTNVKIENCVLVGTEMNDCKQVAITYNRIFTR